MNMTKKTCSRNHEKKRIKKVHAPKVKSWYWNKETKEWEQEKDTPYLDKGNTGRKSRVRNAPKKTLEARK